MSKRIGTSLKQKYATPTPLTPGECAAIIEAAETILPELQAEAPEMTPLDAAVASILHHVSPIALSEKDIAFYVNQLVTYANAA